MSRDISWSSPPSRDYCVSVIEDHQPLQQRELGFDRLRLFLRRPLPQPCYPSIAILGRMFPRAPSPPLSRPDRPATVLSRSRLPSRDNFEDAPTSHSSLQAEPLPPSSSPPRSEKRNQRLLPCRALQVFLERPSR